MKLTAEYWLKYINTHTSANKAAERRMERYIAVHGTDEMDKIADYAYALVSRYGEAAAALSCEMYDRTARAQHVNVPDAIPAETASYGEVASAVRGAGKRSPSLISDAVGRLVKQAGADTTLQNAKRDGAYFAWVAHGDTCAYCMVLSGLGWQKAGKLTLKGGHAEHIHANCDCEYAVDLKGDLEIDGYDPDAINQQIRDMTDDEFDAEDLIRISGHNAKGHDHRGINILRRQHYAANKDHINEQKRFAYAKRVERQRLLGKSKSIHVDERAIQSQDYRNQFKGITGNAEVDDKACNYTRQILKHRSGTYKEDLVLLDADTGKHIFTIDSGGMDNGVTYDDRAEAAIRKAHEDGRRILAIHNHPNSLPPTLDDGVSAYNRGYDLGIVACHDGTVYTYTPSQFALSESVCENVHNAISYQVKTGADIEDVWYNMLNEFGMIIHRR